MGSTRVLPNVKLTACPPEYARCVAQGWDYWQEAFNLSPTIELIDILATLQAQARDAREDGEGTAPLVLGDETFQVQARGAKGGFKWTIANADMLVMIGSPRREWTISVRYLAAAIWEHGVDALRARFLKAIWPYVACTDEADFVRVSRVDWCFDFYSPAFSAERSIRLVDCFVCHPSMKARVQGGWDVIGRPDAPQTYTVGTKSGFQQQLYDKTREIDEASGKTWLYEVWIAALGFNPWPEKPRDVWRLEFRYGGDFLKDRNLRRPHEVVALRDMLIAEAIMKARLTVPSATDHERWRWPLHPLWSEAFRLRGTDEILPIGRKVTGRRQALIDRGIGQMAGAQRSLAILTFGEFSEDNIAALNALAIQKTRDDPEHQKKIGQAIDRYSEVEDAR